MLAICPAPKESARDHGLPGARRGDQDTEIMGLQRLEGCLLVWIEGGGESESL